MLDPLAREAELDVVLAAFARTISPAPDRGARLGPVLFVIVEPFHRLVGISEAPRVIGPDRFGNVMHVVRPQEEVARQNVPPEQIHHLGLGDRTPPSRSGRLPEG